MGEFISIARVLHRKNHALKPREPPPRLFRVSGV